MDSLGFGSTCSQELSVWVTVSSVPDLDITRSTQTPETVLIRTLTDLNIASQLRQRYRRVECCRAATEVAMVNSPAQYDSAAAAF
jgi:hypothetical protein